MTVATNDRCIHEFLHPHATVCKHDQSVSQGIYSAWQNCCRIVEKIWSQVVACASNLASKRGVFHDRDEILMASCPTLLRCLRTLSHSALCRLSTHSPPGEDYKKCGCGSVVPLRLSQHGWSQNFYGFPRVRRSALPTCHTARPSQSKRRYYPAGRGVTAAREGCESLTMWILTV